MPENIEWPNYANRLHRPYLFCAVLTLLRPTGQKQVQTMCSSFVINGWP